MKRIIFGIVSLLLLLCAVDMYATVAKPGKFKYTQPDGTVLQLEVHGDEFFHWVTHNGTTVILGEDGFYRPESKESISSRKAMAGRRMTRASIKPGPVRVLQGSEHYLVLLIDFPDERFSGSDPQQAFSDMLNQKGYSANGGTGSAKDYYRDNSMGVFDPIFDVVGPVTLSKSVVYYGGGYAGGEDRADEALYEACQMVDDYVDFSIYDKDKDGYVDNVFFYYAGHNEAEGAPAYTIWPHSWGLYNWECNCDGVRILSYACTSELRGNWGNEMCGIGTFCHEFGHTIGLPDLYDTDYDSNGSASHPGIYALMASGNYNNNGRTPPCLTAEERQIMGWMDSYTPLNQQGDLVLSSIHTNVAYSTPTSTVGEYFTYEYRNGKGWDAYVPECLLIFHADRSDRIIHGSPASDRWKYWDGINCFMDHPCYYVVMEAGIEGRTSFTSYSNPSNEDWEGLSSGYELTSIKITGENVTCHLEIDRGLKISGLVRSSSGELLKGAKVCLGTMSRGNVSRVSMKRVSSKLKASQQVVETNEEGYYSVRVDQGETTYELTVLCDGYVSQSSVIDVHSTSVRKDFTLKEAGKDTNILKKYGKSEAGMAFGNSSAPLSMMGAVKFSAEELSAYVGDKIMSINFQIYGSYVEKMFALVDFGGDRVLTQTVASPVYGENSVDLSEAGLTIPTGQDVYFGYAVKNCDAAYALCLDDGPGRKGGLYWADYNEYSSTWNEYEGYNIIVSIKLASSSHSMTEIGVNYIDIPSRQMREGDILDLRLVASKPFPNSISWYLDGAAVKDTSIALTSGKHTIKAVLVHVDGSKEIILADISVGQ